MKIQQEIAAMRQMSLEELQKKYAQVFGQPPRAGHKRHLLRRIAWQIQAALERGLTDRARKRAVELAQDAVLFVEGSHKPLSDGSSLAKNSNKRDKRLPMQGVVLVRPYRGQMIEVRVLDQGFEYKGQHYASLTAVAKKITGKHWNGFHFFGLHKNG